MSTIEQGGILAIRDRIPLSEVAKYSVRCIASNIRPKDSINWKQMQITEGVGYEGNLVIGQVDTVDARKEMEHLKGDEIIDIPLLPGDVIVGVLANRHSGTSEYGEVPHDGISINHGTVIDLIAAGGVIGKCLGVPKQLGDTPTRVKAIGLLTQGDGKPADIRDFFPPWETELQPSAPLILSLGTAAEIGKTTTSTKLIEELREQGTGRVAASKLAGTGRKRDIAALKKAGAIITYDFPDIGLPTTYTSPERFIPATYTLLNKLNREGQPEIIVAECGGDIIEGNIPTLLQDTNIMKYVTAIIHSSTDVLSIMGSIMLYEKWNILGRIPIYLTYPIKRNYFAIKARLDEQGIVLPIFDPLNNDDRKSIVEQLLALVNRFTL